MRRIILVGLGTVLVTLGLLYGPAGFFTPSISERTANITRWEGELKVARAAFDTEAAAVKAMGNETASPEAQQTYAYAVEHLDQQSRSLAIESDQIAEEASRKTQQIIITIAFVVGGLLAMGLGLLLGRRKRASSGVPVAIAHPAM